MGVDMPDEHEISMRDSLPEPRGECGAIWEAPRRRINFLLAATALAAVIFFTGLAGQARAATVDLFAAPAATGAADCGTPADACGIVAAVTAANAASVADDVNIKLKNGNYQLSAPTPTALPVTFAGPSLTFEAMSGTPTLNGRRTTRLLSVGNTSNVTVDGLEFVGGLTTGLGGAIENSGTLIVENSAFFGNTGSSGGAIHSTSGATLTVRDSTISNNTATSVGGGAIISYGTTTIERSALLDNEAPINGGSINVQPGGDVKISSSTFAGNSSSGLGGAMSNLGTLNVQASTIAGNSASDGSVIATGNPDVTFTSTILAEQASGVACSPANSAFTDGGYNLDTDGTCISPSTPATGSHNGTTAYGTSTYGEVLNSYLADGPAYNGGPTKTIALLNEPDPAAAPADPAFDAIPSSFNLPVAVGGETAACKVPDQRGVVPATGAGCAIGAYLLQATKTAISSSAAEVGQNVSVTYTVTVSPEPDGGTVSFDDGAGNPATSECASRKLAGDTATCTVSYPNTGTYSVSAAYTGDGAGNNFAASKTTKPATTTVVGPVIDRPLRILGSTPNRRTGVNTIRVQIPAAGTVRLIGYKQLKNTSGHFDAKGTYKLSARPKGKLKRILNERGRARTLVKINYIPDAGRPLAKSRVFPFFKDTGSSRPTDG
ncbi:MAG TPA: right-handed parallel beta-helix repeat-containing protein [Solirubrobacterales bacterium]|nr:right-handed parallel beta-helix repeat-containing protein [Solirubrobacterales bacterium]